MTILPFLLAALSLAVVVVSHFYLRPDARIKRTLKRLPATPIAGARDGEIVKIVGTLAYAGRTVESPLSGRTCAYYSIVVENTSRSPAREILCEERGVDFHVQDGSGVALVRIADVAPLPALALDRSYFTTAVDSDADIKRFMEARGHTIRGLVFYKSLRANEGILEAGEKVAVAGLARWVPDADAAGGSYRESAKRLVLEATEAVPLFLSDDPAAL